MRRRDERSEAASGSHALSMTTAAALTGRIRAAHLARAGNPPTQQPPRQNRQPMTSKLSTGSKTVKVIMTSMGEFDSV